jgi:FemAB-related protein (PEP-CTERM system-associated)
MDYGGVCGNGDQEAERALAERAVAIAEEQGAKLVLRYLREPGLDLPVSHEKVTMFLDLGTSESALWERLPATRRNRIRKGQKSELQVRFPEASELERFYTVFATNMRDLGSPVHGTPFFREILERLPRNARLVLVEQGSLAVGAALMLVFNGVISLPWISSLRPYFSLCPNQVLYWEAMKWGIGEGQDILDFGRSSRDSGTFEAKRQWGAEPVPLYWHYWPGNAVPPGEDVKKLSWGVHLWQRLPLPVANRVGPWLRAGIPN